MKSNCSLIVSTYNWPLALNVCLKSVLQQSVMPAEIIIADDGSTSDTLQLVQKFTAESPVPVIHVWQPDDGFQLARIRNRAIAKVSTPYIIQIDGDLVLHRHFIKDHLRIKEPGHFVSGSRVLLSPETSERLLKHENPETVNKHKGGKNFFNRYRSRLLQRYLSRRYKITGKNKYYVKGCNMAFWKNDLVAVNGYNGAFTGWGREDSELAIRLINNGIKKKFLKMGGVAYHIYHREACRQMEEKNTVMMEDAIRQKLTKAEDGLSKYF